MRICTSARADARLRLARAWLAAFAPGTEVVILASSLDAAADLVRGIPGSTFGFHRFTLGSFAAVLAKQELAVRDLVSAGPVAIEALCARVAQDLAAKGHLGRYAEAADMPGFPRALARTLGELRGATTGTPASAVPLSNELARALAAFETALAAASLADRARVFQLATDVARDTHGRHPLLDHPILLLDAPVESRVEAGFIAALTARASEVLVTLPAGDEQSLGQLRAHGPTIEVVTTAATDSLGRVQQRLFTSMLEPHALDDTVHIFSAPGESRECVEVARRILRAAEQGVPFDRMAILLRSPESYRVHLGEALARAGVPSYFARGTRTPDPAGRAFLALLACTTERFSARRFAEYASLGEVPLADATGAPPPATDRWVPPDDELGPTSRIAPEPAAEPSEGEGLLRAPWRWERLLVDAAVIGGRERWERRLAGLEAQLQLEVADDEIDDAVRAAKQRTLVDLGHLRSFALPLLADLAALPATATWGAWIDRLSALATRALRTPDRVLATLAAFSPMREVGPVALAEIERVLAPQLRDLAMPPTGERYGKVFVAPITAARGLAFDRVFVPGLAERMFPQKVDEDPLLLDDARRRLGLDLPCREERLAGERLALRLAVGAAVRSVVLSYPRIDAEQGRPRVPSFYGLEVLAAAEGALPDFGELARRADTTGAIRIGWPAPAEALDAIDEAEHDLALLDGLVRTRSAPAGAANYLLGTNPHLARSLRSRGRRWQVTGWKPADGLVVSTDEARAALAAHQPTERSFSPTALEQLAACPLRFAYRTLMRLEPRTEPEPIEAIDPLMRGKLVHDAQFRLLLELRDAGMLPVRAANLDEARARLDVVLDRVVAQFHEELAPAIERVWTDSMASIRADLREWLRRTSENLEWTPHRFELAFGLERGDERDPQSVDEPVPLTCGLSVRGSIDLVEVGANGAVRAVDTKTGKAKWAQGSIVAGGRSLQPVLYALVLEQLLPEAGVAGGVLDYCTSRGDFQQVTVPLDVQARAAADTLGATVAEHLRKGFFPAAPSERECTYCDYRPICGPHEEQRAKKKQREPLAALTTLRRLP